MAQDKGQKDKQWSVKHKKKPSKIEQHESQTTYLKSIEKSRKRTKENYGFSNNMNLLTLILKVVLVQRYSLFGIEILKIK